MKLKKKNSIKFFLFINLILNFIGHILENNIVIYLSIFLIILYMIISNVENNIYVLFITHPFFNLFSPRVGESVSLYYLFILIYLIKNTYQFIKEKRLGVLLKKYFIFLCIIIFTSRNFYGNISIDYFSWLIFTLLFIFLYENKNINIHKIINYYTVSFIYSSILGYIAINNSMTQLFPVDLGYVWNNGKISLRFVGLIGETNAYAQIALVLITLNYINVIISDLKREKIKYISYILILFLFSILTYSKMFIISIIIIGLLILINSIYNNINRGINLKAITIFTPIFLVIIFVSILYIINNVDNSIISNYLVRFSKEDLSTGRFSVYGYFFNILKSNFIYILFGIGFYKYNIPWGYTNGVIGKHAHNIYLEFILLFGVIGFIILSVILILKIKRNINKGCQYILFIPLIIFLITGISLHSIITNYFYFILLLILPITNDEDYIKKIKKI